MIIKKLETFSNSYVSFVKLTAEDGSIGWGQLSTYHSDITAKIFHRQVAPWALGKDTDDLDKLIDLITDREHKFPGSYLRRAISGLDTAVWDLRGRVASKSVVELLGGSPGKLRAYASSMKRDITPKDEALRLKVLRDEKGFDAFKVRAGAEVGRDTDEWLGRTEEIIPTIRKELGSEVDLLIDANSCYSPKRAIQIGHILEDNNFCHFEEPCPYWELEQTKEVTDTLSIDVTGGEQDCDLSTWRRMIDMRAVNIVQPDILYLGGINRTLRVVKMANDAKIPITPHCANLSLVTLFTMHLLKAISGGGKYLEFSIEGADYYPWQENLFINNPFEIENGMVEVPDTPGWGIEINPHWLENSSYEISEI